MCKLKNRFVIGQRATKRPRSRRSVAAWTVAAGLILSAAVSRAEGQRLDTAITKAALLAADLELAHRAAAGEQTAVLDLLEPDAPVLFPGIPILSGVAATESFIARYGGGANYSWRPLHAVASADGTFGCTMGASRFATKSAPAERRGAYLTCWRRGIDGQWRIAALQRGDSPPEDMKFPDDAPLRDGPGSATVSLAGDARRETQDTDSAFAQMSLRTGPGPAFAKFATVDAVNLSVPELARGRDSIRALFAEWPSDVQLLWQPMRSYGGGSGGLAFTVGHSETKRTAADAPLRKGKFLTIWRQEADGSWLYVFDLGSPR